jgi:hypothetical protein
LFVPPHRFAFHELSQANSPAVIPNFPEATKELAHAGNCYASGEFTACVFHTQRAVERALKAIHSCLGLAQPASGFAANNWQQILQRIKEEMLRRGTAWSERGSFENFYVMIGAIKDAWRNTTMHVDVSYSENEALRILTVVRDLISDIAKKMDENGEPKA